MAAELVDAHPSDMDEGDVQDAARLIEWLVDGRFALLGHRLHDHRDQQPAASGLGLLRREEVAGRVLDGVALDPSEDGDILVLTRAGTASRVFRPVHPSVLAVRITDRMGRAVREHHFLGALTRAALHEDVLAIPRIGRRVRASVHRAGVHLESYTGQRMLEVIAEYPREDLFWAGEELLHDLAAGVPALTQPRRLRLLVGREPFRRFFSCLVHLPRDRYSTRARQAMEEVLLHELRGWRIEHSARIGGESRLAAVHFTVYTAAPSLWPDRNRLEGQLAAAILTWDEWVLDAAGARDQDVVDQLAGVPEAYKSDVDPVQALADLRVIRSLGKDPELRLSVEPGPIDVEMKLRFFLDGRGVTLSAVLPVLHSLGVEVLDERPYEFVQPDGGRCWLYTFGLRVDEGTSAEIRTRPIVLSRELFCAAFAAAWRGEAESDGFSALVLRTGLAWREVAVLRAVRPVRPPARQPVWGQVHGRHAAGPPGRGAGAARSVHRALRPGAAGAARGRGRRVGQRAQELIDAVTGLDADRILRGFLGMIGATLRTNFYRERPFLSFKIDPSAVPDMPAPRPRFEIFVYSPRVEGVHLRYGPVARGGLRWSDRPQDFRTEILGLVKAQAVKNAVIVPVGAKGGFVVRRPRGGWSTRSWPAIGRSSPGCSMSPTIWSPGRMGALRLFRHRMCVRHDGDDAYPVVAADKGTAQL